MVIIYYMLYNILYIYYIIYIIYIIYNILYVWGGPNGKASACNQQITAVASKPATLQLQLLARLRSSLISCEKGSTLPGVRAVVHDCLIKGIGMPSRLYATGHISDPVPLILGPPRGEWAPRNLGFTLFVAL